jgi:hypothetical protein
VIRALVSARPSSAYTTPFPRDINDMVTPPKRQSAHRLRIQAPQSQAHSGDDGLHERCVDPRMEKAGMRIETNPRPGPPYLQVVGIIENKVGAS